ncbi:hypothetical protein [Pseudoxanthomonas mexicana]|uniref:hypothetical protein n=1 Tax=Pseudoxanthomonas mexicana TaxID=128785 RepID=UPI0022F3B3CE|nr:hypothetical protein [Pseudoxanthomonas mexicana]WBX91889.1 hypothetical protein PE064_09030 [Pseudoxanthomonas mexicana]
MSGLAFASAPRPSLPMRFLVAALAWGAVAGLWLAWQGEIALLSRWTPATLVLVHVFALGLLGNAMLGSLAQFLPVAAGSPLPGTRVVPWLHAAFNAGLALLLATLAASSHALALPAGGLLGGSLAIFALLALVAVIRGKGARVVREGIGLALLALIATAALGLLLLAARTGWRGPAAAGMVDVHAAFGVIGWVLGLLAAVGGVTLPMLQGTRTLPVPALRTWQIASMLTLGISVATLADVVPGSAWRLAAWPLAAFALTVYVLQARAPHRRNPVLRRFWQAGCACLFAASLLALRPDVPLVPLGVLVLGVGLPLLVVGMALEITAFLTWIALRQRVPRGVRVPGVGSLFEEADRRRAFVLHAVAGAWLVAAAFAPALARSAGLAIALAYAVSLHGQWRCWRQAATWRRAGD